MKKIKRILQKKLENELNYFRQDSNKKNEPDFAGYFLVKIE